MLDQIKKHAAKTETRCKYNTNKNTLQILTTQIKTETRYKYSQHKQKHAENTTQTKTETRCKNRNTLQILTTTQTKTGTRCKYNTNKNTLQIQHKQKQKCAANRHRPHRKCLREQQSDEHGWEIFINVCSKR